MKTSQLIREAKQFLWDGGESFGDRKTASIRLALNHLPIKYQTKVNEVEYMIGERVGVSFSYNG